MSPNYFESSPASLPTPRPRSNTHTHTLFWLDQARESVWQRTQHPSRPHPLGDSIVQGVVGMGVGAVMAALLSMRKACTLAGDYGVHSEAEGFLWEGSAPGCHSLLVLPYCLHETETSVYGQTPENAPPSLDWPRAPGWVEGT